MNKTKKAKALIAMALAAAALLLTPIGYSLTLRATAAEQPVTYAVKYVDSMGDWRFQAGTSTFDEGVGHRELYYLHQQLKEGDLVVVYNDSDSSRTLDLGKTRLSNLTVAQSRTFTVIYSGPIDECYVLANSPCSINADVKNAHVYDTATVNFNNNVDTLKIYSGSDRVYSNVACVGTVGHLFAQSTSTNEVFYDLYDFQVGSLNIQNGALLTKEDKYGKTPVLQITADNFDHVRYANDYPDLKNAFGYDANALYSHYVNYGAAEKRVAHIVYGDFDYMRYANDYPDLRAAFGNDAVALYNHYITLGISEKRVAYTTSNKVYR